MNDEVVLFDSPEAAKQTTVIGWVSRRGIFYGDGPHNERTARYDGCTHVKCKYCGELVVKSWTACDKCREKSRHEKYLAMKKKEWDGDTPLYSDTYSEYFWCLEDIEMFCEDRDIKSYDELELLVCEPQYASEVYPEDLYDDLAPEDKDDFIPDDIKKAFEELNKKIKKCKTPISWFPGECAAVVGKEDEIYHDVKEETR